MGITKMQSSKSIFITMDENEIESIDFNWKPEGKTYPPSKFSENDKLLKGFIWREEERPKTMEDIFIYDDIPSNLDESTSTKILK